jgi:arylsulfatase A-like enzyme
MKQRVGAGLIAGLGWGLAVSLADGLPLLWQGTPWPHLGQRLLALAYLAAIYGVIGALLGTILAALGFIIVRLFRRRASSPIPYVIGTLGAGTLAAVWGQRIQPEPLGWVLIAILSAATGLGVGWLAARVVRHGSTATGSETHPGLGLRALPVAIASLFLLALLAVASSAIVHSVQGRQPAQAAVAGQAMGPPNIVLITASGIRADHLGVYGYEPAVSPNLDALAARGVRFEQAIAPGSWSRPSTAALLTSLYPGALGYHRDATGVLSPAPDSMRTTLAEALQATGYHTGAILASVWFNADGFAQGFDTFDAARDQAPYDRTPMRGRMLGWLLGCGKDTTACRLYLQGRDSVMGAGLMADQGDEAINTRAARFLDQHAGEPFFLWINYDDALPPYSEVEPLKPIAEDPLGNSVGLLARLDYWALGAPFTARETLLPLDAAGLTSLYDGEVQHVDGLVGALLVMLDEHGLTDRTVVVVASDHGQELGDHGGYTYGHTLYDEVVRVPIIVAGPGVAAVGQAVDTPVSLIDLAPTLAEMAGTVLSGEAQGISLVPALQGQALDERPVFSEALYRVPFDQQAIRSGGYKLIYRESDVQVELYDLQADPAESHDLAAERPDVADALRNDLQQWKSQMQELERTGLPHSTSHDADADKLW